MGSGALVGRVAELAESKAVLDAALAGNGGVVLLTGEPGIGKTRLADELARHAASGGAEVRWASCWEGGGTPPFWPFVQLLRAGPDASAAGVLDDVEAAGEQARFALFDAVAQSLFEGARTRPLVAVVDDLQWADTPSLLLLSFLIRALHGVPMAIVATARDEDLAGDETRDAIIGELAARVTHIGLRGLGGDDVGALLEATTGTAPTPAAAAAVCAHTAGNPFFVTQVGRLLSSEGKLAARRSWQPLPLPDDVRAVLRRRLARLSQPCHQLLEVAAVAGKRFDADVVNAVVGAQTGEWRLDEAAIARVVQSDDGRTWEFVHDLVRQALYEDLTPSRRKDLHAAVGRALEATYGDDVDAHLAELAYHFLHAGETGAAGAGTSYAARAGRRAMAQLAYEDAVAHLQRALDALGPPNDATDAERTRLLLELGEARLRAGDRDAARRDLADAADLARRRGRPDDLALAALGVGVGLGGFEVPMLDHSQVELLEEALGGLGDDESVLRARVMGRLSVALAWMDQERQLTLADAAVALARRLGDDRALTYALSTWCDAYAGPAHVEARIAAASEMLELARRAADREGTLLARRLRVLALLEQGDPEVDVEIAAYRALADELGAPLFRWYTPLFLGTRAQMAGRFERAEELLEEAERLGALASSENASMLTVSLRFAIRREQGRGSELREGMERFGEQYGWPLGVLPWLATLYAETGDHLAARQMLDRVIASLDDLPQNAELIPSLCFVADAIHCLGDDQAAALVYPRLARYGHLFAVDGIAGSCTGSVSRQLGHLAALLGRAGDAVAHYERAVEANVRGGADFYAARARQDLERCRQPANPAAPATPAPASPAAFVAEGSVWRLSYDGATVTMPDAKGLHDLAWLLAHPGKEIAAADLMGLDATTTLPAGDDTLDDRARAAYRRRLAELEDDLAEAEDHHDVERAARAREERDFLAAELAAALGLGGRARRLGDPSERARKAVTMRIRNSIGRMAKVHPVLARHLDRSVRTGAFCCYEPERPVEWRL